MVNGNEIIKINRQKTNEQSTVPLLPAAKELIDKYKDCELCKVSGTLLPVRTNQSLNRGLKIIGQMSGITKNVSCHTAQHTFATLSLENRIAIETVSKA